MKPSLELLGRQRRRTLTIRLLMQQGYGEIQSLGAGFGVFLLKAPLQQTSSAGVFTVVHSKLLILTTL